MRRLSGLLCGLVLTGVVSAEEIDAGLGGERFSLQVVDEPEERRQGLMGRMQLAEGSGMLFDFAPGTTPSIWMRNMHIPLDLIFLDRHARITHLFEGVPPCEALPCTVYRADRPLRFVIEVPAGTAARLGLQVGDHVDLGDKPEQPAPKT